MSINPIKATETIGIKYQNYLSTAFRFQDPVLQRQLLENLQQKGRFIKGPILEVTPAFKTGASIADLIEEGVLSKEFYQLKTELMPVDRRLYQHQEMAVRKLTTFKRNIVVSTGTGSGKTETFLIPILDHLFKEIEKKSLGPGVRALLLYPMNALANDQLKRLRLLLKNYRYITFGRYTGETEKMYSNALDKYRKMFQEDPLRNELISREQMWQTPPHILLTNYAMLEYLLLRPQDTVFFDGDLAGHWRFIVIDEAHTYSGAKGIEIAMLLRRLKDRVVESQKGKLQCIATSATLGGKRDNYPQIVHFAQQLFGEKFEWVEGDDKRQDVIEASRLPLVGTHKSWGKAESWVYADWERLVDKNHLLELEKLLTEMYLSGLKAGIPKSVLVRAVEVGREHGWQAFLYEVLKGDELLLKLQQELQEEPKPLLDMLDVLGMTSPNSADVVVSLVNLANQARINKDFQPLLPARYHVFVRAIEGAYLSLRPEKKLFLERYEKILKDGEEYKVFEAATCRQCGATYIIGQRERNGNMDTLKNVTWEKGKIEYYLLIERELETQEHDEDEEVEFPGEFDYGDRYQKYLLCLRCGAIDQDNVLRFPCDCGEVYRMKLLHVPSNTEGKVFLCPSCGKRSPNGVVWRFLVGTDASASVLASALYRQIVPKKKVEAKAKPIEEDEDDWVSNGEGSSTAAKENIYEGARKLLVFSDSRQDAAFFAPYLNRTYNQILHRSLIVKTLIEKSDIALNNSWRLQDLIYPLREIALRAGFFKGWSSQEQTNEVWKWLMQEFLAIDHRISLEGLGLLGFSPVDPQGWSPPKPLSVGKWNLFHSEILTLLKVLLDSIRTKGAVTFPDQVSPRDECFQPRNREFYFRCNDPVPPKGIFSWNSTRINSRLDYLVRLAQNLGTGITEQECREVLDKLWNRVLDPERSKYWKDYFASKTVREVGVLYQIRHNMWEIKSPLIDENVQWYICDKCKNLTLHNVRGTCPTYRCRGRLQHCDPRELFKDNHYFQLYMDIPPIRMQAEEHTAQLTSEAAAELQNKFVLGQVNILSCSTTFELGVDVGELEAVFMRNMPPSAANYIQRAGRAGRRTDSTAFVLTYAQRRSHDLDHYREPWRMVSGKIKAPYFALENEKVVQRHVYATALSSFWKKHKELFGTVENFFFDPGCFGPKLFEEYLNQKPDDLKSSLFKIVPRALHEQLEINNWKWALRLFEQNGVMSLAASEIVSDVARLEELKQQLFNKNRKVDHITRLIRTLKEKDIIGFLSNHNIIPKYGFPVDVVELQILHHSEEAKRLQLERDLRIALSEYAPSSQVVAGGKLWTSRYIRRLPDREWESFYYAICDQCQNYISERAELAERYPYCNICGSRFGKNQGIFIVPAFGFVADLKNSDNPGEEKPERTYTTRVYFSGQSSGEERVMQIKFSGGIDLKLATASRGKLAVLNNAGHHGFHVCRWCGYTIIGSEGAPNSHQTYWGSPCKGQLNNRYSIGHEFETDILKLHFNGYQDARDGFWHSLLYALLEGASSAMQIERQDLDGCLYPMPGNPITSPALILFDDVPGGAGHVRRLAREDSFREILLASLKRLQRCECGGTEGNASCYGCLRHYRNQFCHDILNRGMVIEFLSKILSK